MLTKGATLTTPNHIWKDVSHQNFPPVIQNDMSAPISPTSFHLVSTYIRYEARLNWTGKDVASMQWGTPDVDLGYLVEAK